LWGCSAPYFVGAKVSGIKTWRRHKKERECFYILSLFLVPIKVWQNTQENKDCHNNPEGYGEYLFFGCVCISR